MTYSLFLIVCIIVHVIINFDLFAKKQAYNHKAKHAYRIFVLAILAYFIVDMLWGIFEENKLSLALYIDTVIYFVLMGFTILCWMRFAVMYMETQGIAKMAMLIVGNLFFLAEIVLLIINIFNPILFEVDMQSCVYVSYKARNIMLYVQILLYFLMLGFTIVFMIRSKGSFKRRYLAICLYSAVQASAIIVQIYDPYIAYYSIGCILGSVLLETFLVNDTREEYKNALIESQKQLHQGEIQLNETKIIAYSDPLTGAKNKYAYVEEEERIDRLIAEGTMLDFAVIVFDLNGLKEVNDTKGHDAGDNYIVESCRVISSYFGDESLYRFGGDEFVVILEGTKMLERLKKLQEFERFIDDCLHSNKPIIASGMSRYRRGVDNTYHAVFKRADKIMYARKDALKEHR